MVDPRVRTVTIYRTAIEAEVAREGAVIDGQSVLPGWQVDTGALFAKLDLGQPS
jgi:hypothetical protein